MEPLIAVYDACVLYPAFLRDFLIRLAIQGRHEGVFRAKWTGRIHREWIRAVLRDRLDLKRTHLARTRRLMDQHVRGCRVLGYERWEQRLTLPDENDRHVLAAALACVADVIVTFNTTDFPASVLEPFGVAALTPDAFVCLLEETTAPGLVRRVSTEHRAALTRPALSPEEYQAALRRNGLPGVASVLSAEGA
jgi:hypothetical protein